MITEWKYLAVVITTNKTAGKQLAKLAAKFPDDPGSEDGAFEDGYILSPQGWVMQTPCTQAFVDVLDALTSNASIDDPRLAYLQDRGLTASLWGQAKQIIKADWYQMVQDDGTITPQENFLENFLTAEGYTYSLPEPVGP